MIFTQGTNLHLHSKFQHPTPNIKGDRNLTLTNHHDLTLSHILSRSSKTVSRSSNLKAHFLKRTKFPTIWYRAHVSTTNINGWKKSVQKFNFHNFEVTLTLTFDLDPEFHTWSLLRIPTYTYIPNFNILLQILREIQNWPQLTLASHRDLTLPHILSRSSKTVTRSSNLKTHFLKRTKFPTIWYLAHLSTINIKGWKKSV